MSEKGKLVFTSSGPDGLLRVTLEYGGFRVLVEDEYGNAVDTKISGVVASHLIAAIKLKLEGK